MEIIVQPSESNRLGDFLNRNLSSSSWTQFRAAVAFVKRSGVQHIRGNLASFAEHRKVEMVVGIDHRGTSFEGLHGLLSAVSPKGRVLVFHNPSHLTFHPKLFLFRSDIAAEMVIGSGNLTAGGLYNNYEVGAGYKLDLSDPTDAAVLQSVEALLEYWADESSGTTTLLDLALLDNLLSAGFTPLEESMESPSVVGDPKGNRGTTGDDWFPFVGRREPGAPRVVRDDLEAIGDGLGVTANGEPVDAALLGPAAPVGFVMTLQQTDMGMGQTTAGAQQRSPEIFIPLAARDAYPGFWRWPDAFAVDPERAGKRDRHDVHMRLGGEVIRATLSYFHHRRDFRLRSTELRNAGNVGDILRVERALDSDAGYEYYVEVVPRGTTAFQQYLGRCQKEVGHGSQKRYGYY